MVDRLVYIRQAHVALRKESVDRNCALLRAVASFTVALRKESVDRNIGASYGRTAKMVVALRKESVDRNHIHTDK